MTDLLETNSNASDECSDDVSRDYRALQTILRKTQRHYRVPLFVEGFLWYGATLSAVVLSLFALALVFPATASDVSTILILTGWGGATLAAALVLMAHRRRQKRGVYAIAAQLQRKHKEFRNDLVAALEFGESLTSENSHDYSYSEALASAHIKQTARKVVELSENGHLAHLLPARNFMPSSLALAGTTTILGLTLLFAPQWSTSVLFGAFLSDAAQVERGITAQPVVGEISLLFTYPSYTGFDQRVYHYSTGHIEVLTGTEVTLMTYPVVSAEQFEMVVQTSDGRRVIPMRVNADGLLEGALLVTENGSYSFQAHTSEGKLIEDRIERVIRVLPDEVPEVHISSHEGEVEVRPDDVLELHFNVSDDFGIASVSAMYHFAMDEADIKRESIDMPGLSSFPRNTDGTFVFDLAPLDLQPRDTIILFLEARDNNNVTGPGVGTSQTLLLNVASPEDKHLKNIADQQALLEKLLLHLADFLETPMGRRVVQRDKSYRQILDNDKVARDQQPARFHALSGLHTQREPLLAEMGKLAERLRDDPLMRVRNVTMFESLYGQLNALQSEGDTLFKRLVTRAQAHDLTRSQLQQVADYAAKSEDTLEKGVLRFEELLATQKMDAIQATAQGIRELKDRLRELLEQYRDTQDPELREAIRREIHRLRQRMNELMARMQDQMAKLPQEHVNMEALQQAQMESETKQLSDSLQSIEEMLDRGDIDGALEALEQMEASLDALTGDLDDQFSSAQPQGVSELDKALAEMMDAVNDLEALEKSIEQDTRLLQQEIAERRQQEMQDVLKPFTEEMLKKVETQKQALERVEKRDLPQRDRMLIGDAQRRIDSLKQMLEHQDIQQSLEEARASLDSLQSLKFTMELSQRYTPEGSTQHRELKEGARDVQNMLPRGQEITDALEEMMNQAQERLRPQEQQKMQELAERQEQASEQCDSVGNQLGEASQRFPMLEQQLRPSLERAQQSMRQAQQGLEEQEIQRALDNERAALDQIRQLRQEMRNALQQERNEQQRQGRHRQHEKVEIPQQDSRQHHEQYRKEVLEGMREGRLDDYQQEIERYYRSLME